MHDERESMVFAEMLKDQSNLVITNSRRKDALFKAYNSVNDAIRWNRTEYYHMIL